MTAHVDARHRRDRRLDRLPGRPGRGDRQGRARGGTLFYALVTVTELFVAGQLSGLLHERRERRMIDALADHSMAPLALHAEVIVVALGTPRSLARLEGVFQPAGGGRA